MPFSWEAYYGLLQPSRQWREAEGAVPPSPGLMHA